jgi:hypothetical protein
MSIYIDKNLFYKNPVYKSIPQVYLQKLQTGKNPQPFGQQKPRQKLQKLPTSKNLGYAKHRFYHVFLLSRIFIISEI